jgi:hypothetical protein
VVKRYTGDAVAAGDIPGPGVHVLMTNNGSNWILMAPGIGIGSGVFGPNTSKQNHFAFWNNVNGTLLSGSPQNPGNFVPMPDFTGVLNDTPMASVSGSSGTPDTTTTPVIAVQKVGSQSADAAANPAVYGAQVATSGADSSHGTAIMGSTIDPIGHTGGGGLNLSTFYEGVRGQANAKSGAVNSFVTGTVGEATAEFGSTYTTLLGGEFAVNNYTGVDAPAAFDDITLNVAVLASCGDRGAVAHIAKCGQAFQVNENNAVPFRYGFFVPPGNSVDVTAFYSAATAQIGMDLANGIYSVSTIRIPNGNQGGLITGFDHNGPSVPNALRILGINGFDQLVIGDDVGLDSIIMGTTGVPLLLNNPAIVLQNNVAIQAFNAANNAQLSLIKLNALDQLVVGEQNSVNLVAITNVNGLTPTALNSITLTAPNLPSASSGKCLGINTTTHQIYVSSINCT